MNKLFDIACNFTSKRFDDDLIEVIEKAIQNDVNKFALICSQISDFEKDLFELIKSSHSEIIKSVNSSGDLDEETGKKLSSIIEEFKKNR